MRKIIVLSMVSLDGVIQSPGSPTEDRSGHFPHGGWVAPYDDAAYDRVVKQELKPADYLLGRKTFDIWARYWPHHAAFWPGINQGHKYVLSRRLKKTDPLVTGWNNTHVIRTIADIRAIKETAGRDLQVWGSSALVQLLLKHDLVDELRLKMHPLVLGKGKQLFSKGPIPLAFSLTRHIVTSKGVIIANYRRAGDVRTGTIGA
jgi:dihydrofolate reductase